MLTNLPLLIMNSTFIGVQLLSLYVLSRGVTIHDATIRYVSRYKPRDTVYDTIHKTRYTTKAEAPQQSPGPIK